MDLKIEAARLNEILARKLDRFPRPYQKIIIEDMIKFGLLSRENHMFFKLIDNGCDKILNKWDYPLW